MSYLSDCLDRMGDMAPNPNAVTWPEPEDIKDLMEKVHDPHARALIAWLLHELLGNFEEIVSLHHEVAELKDRVAELTDRFPR